MRRHVLLAGAASILATVSATVAWLVRDPAPWFADRYRGLASVEPMGAERLGADTLQSARLVDASGLAVDVTWRRGLADGGRRLPVALILGGHVTGATAARLVGPTPGVLVMAVSYPYDGAPRPSRIESFTRIPSIRRAFLDTPPAIRLALDHLYAMPEVDTTRIEGVGVSLGAPFVTIAAALDPRMTRVWAVHGSGGWYAPLESSLRLAVHLAPLRAAAAAVAGVLIGGPRLAPERWVAAIAPRPFIMVSAADDERLPRAAIQALFEAAGEPREHLWMSGRHVHGDAHTIGRLAGIVRERIAADHEHGFHERRRGGTLVGTPPALSTRPPSASH